MKVKTLLILIALSLLLFTACSNLVAPDEFNGTYYQFKSLTMQEVGYITFENNTFNWITYDLNGSGVSNRYGTYTTLGSKVFLNITPGVEEILTYSQYKDRLFTRNSLYYFEKK